MAEQLKAADVPVTIMFGFDPAPIAGRVPENVDLFINLYQKTNLIGGGEAKAAIDFRDRIVNVDLRERHEIAHVTLDKISRLTQSCRRQDRCSAARSRAPAGAGA